MSARSRVLILTAEVGEGHVQTARTLADDLAESSDVEVEILDALEGLGAILGFLLLRAYRWQLRAAPWIFGLLYRLFSRFAWMRASGGIALGVLGGRSLFRLVDTCGADVVISTYPAATVVLGRLKRRGRLACPLHAVITDIGGLAFWTHPGVDVHYVMDDWCVAEVGRLVGPGRATRVAPLVGREFFSGQTKRQARRRLALAGDAQLIVVSGGGWGVGDLAGAVRAALTVSEAHVICLAGRSEPTRQRLQLAFGGDSRVAVWGFTDQMSTLLAAADVLVHSTGGVTCLEALVSGCAVIAYGAPPGHARLTARTMASLGLVHDAKTPGQLLEALQSSLGTPLSTTRRLPAAPAAGDLVLLASLAAKQDSSDPVVARASSRDVAVDLAQ